MSHQLTSCGDTARSFSITYRLEDADVFVELVFFSRPCAMLRITGEFSFLCEVL